ncbi:MAG: acyl carrier protein phosphodiesterase [Bacteroidota bacterium]|nr:acyl carrier protein phosphodiesterase [Bacteroidota bacterium]
MNFLGHLFLSGNDDEIILGNFIADHVKGKAQLEYTPGVINGIRLHRAIDHYTDHHSMIIQGVRRLNGDFGRYASVIIDMYYDHFLASLWSEYHPISLDIFSRDIFDRLLPYFGIMPSRTQHMLPHMISNNWLTAYAKTEGLGRALNGLSSRAKFNSGMEKATAFLIDNYGIFKEEFRLFMPDIIAYTDNWKKSHQIL